MVLLLEKQFSLIQCLMEKIAVNEHVFIMNANNLLMPKLLFYLISSDLE
jgi:hypothetical protein